MRWMLVAAGALVLALGTAHAQEKAKPADLAIENGHTVKIEYTLKDDAGQVLDTNKGKEALSYTAGQRQIIPGLEKALNGLKAGQEKKVSIPPEEGYGTVNPKAQIEVPKEAVPPGVTVGARLTGRSQSGGPMVVRVKEIKEKTVVLDTNHPLAGQTLHFDVKILGVEPPKK